MAAEDPLARSVAALGRFYIGGSTLGDALQHVVDLAAIAVPPARYTGISMLVEDEVATSVFSDPAVREIDQAQYETGSGPCLDSFRHRTVCAIASTGRDDRWVQFSRAALAHGIHSTLSLPLVVGDRPLGAMNLYSEHEEGFLERDHQAGELFAAQAAALLANAHAHDEARALAEHLTEAMRSRATIEQARGILIAQSGVDAEAAFELLKRASQRENRKLRDVAREIVQRHSRS